MRYTGGRHLSPRRESITREQLIQLVRAVLNKKTDFIAGKPQKSIPSASSQKT